MYIKTYSYVRHVNSDITTCMHMYSYVTAYVRCAAGDFGIAKNMDNIDVASTCVGTPCYPRACSRFSFCILRVIIWRFRGFR